MEDGLKSGVQALSASQKRMEFISANLANLQAPGYKRLNSFTHVIESVRQGRKTAEMQTDGETDFSQGALEHTGNPLDFALDGGGFFAVESPGGEAYTRNGRFHLDSQGTLLTEEGQPVVWEGGQGRFQPVGPEIQVDETGAVRQGKNQIGRLKIVDFADRTKLEVDAKGGFHPRPDARRTTPTALVRGGSLERSNTDSIDELVSMIRVQRSFESATKLISSIDQSYKRLNAPR